MARVKSLLKKHEVETAQRKRTCKNSGEAIVMGEVCLVVQDGIHSKYPYCRTIALQMIAAARERLDEIEAELSGT
jgi:hypothetical protein